MSALFRRCGCRDEAGGQYSVLPEDLTPAQRAKACPQMLLDPKHGRWSFRLSAGYDPVTRKRRQVNGRTYSTKREAQRARNEALVKVDRGEVAKHSRVTLAEYVPAWLARRQRTGRGLRPTTVENYTRYVQQDIVPSRLGGVRLEDVRKHHLNAFVDDLAAAGRGAVTIRRIVAVLQGALRAAADDELVPANPATRLALPRVDTKPFRPWEPEQVGHFLDVAALHRLGALFEVGVFTGLRRGELVALQWADVDLARRTLTVRASKTDAGRRVLDIDDRTIGALLAWQLAQDAERAACGPIWSGTGHVFTYADGQPLKPQYATRLFDKLRLQAGLPKMTLHGSRHTNASLMIAAGTDLVVVSKRLGHSSVQVTGDIYAHLIGSASRDAANRAADLVPARRALGEEVAHTMHAHRSENAAEAAPDDVGTASDLQKLQSG